MSQSSRKSTSALWILYSCTDVRFLEHFQCILPCQGCGISLPQRHLSPKMHLHQLTDLGTCR